MAKSYIELSLFTNEVNNQFDPTSITTSIGINDNVKTGYINEPIPGKKAFLKRHFGNGNVGKMKHS